MAAGLLDIHCRRPRRGRREGLPRSGAVCLVAHHARTVPRRDKDLRGSPVRQAQRNTPQAMCPA